MYECIHQNSKNYLVMVKIHWAFQSCQILIIQTNWIKEKKKRNKSHKQIKFKQNALNIKIVAIEIIKKKWLYQLKLN